MQPLRLLPGVADSLWHTTKHISGHIIFAHHFIGDKEKSRPDNEPASGHKTHVPKCDCQEHHRGAVSDVLREVKADLQLTSCRITQEANHS